MRGGASGRPARRSPYKFEFFVPFLRDEKGRLVAVRPRPQQFRTLANGVLGLAEAMEEAER